MKTQKNGFKGFAFFTVYLTLCFLFLFTTSASAYIDPSTTTFVIQAVAGVAIAIGAAVVVYWRKAKKRS